jgi:GNAT superfamily N-acetyltransferase
MKIQYWESCGKCYIQLIDNTATLVSKAIIDLNCDEYIRYKEYCNNDRLAKIIRIETNSNYVGKGYASKLLNFVIKKFKNYNLLLLCSPQKRCEDTDTLTTVADLQMFYSKFGFVKTDELLPTMIRKSNIK